MSFTVAVFRKPREVTVFYPRPNKYLIFPIYCTHNLQDAEVRLRYEMQLSGMLLLEWHCVYKNCFLYLLAVADMHENENILITYEEQAINVAITYKWHCQIHIKSIISFENY